ncbi:hypothetical protein TVAG_317840 [Trichomonas vaginalis G3]|uniref:HECT domain-containing protein n=1 Tax=Trichomonas vaginalis (strain ATCC PRA-98 / G3) TaxID=412133 RepID=A2F3N1_TRIV3|nr:guanyl-nucleotide exchange factor protein [Trichomonas vaginalis G3]EAY00499.1 hypothetical protein TVAG_317840 [Trichomonas vaginalis G3]KAI5520543.1 guanyl-nucleotide exchange factor protein [Trichomonas vaginalis G3]|eukprot:XP_001313428.1 hypothetical protein [Trichomonas vaginalis G3]
MSITISPETVFSPHYLSLLTEHPHLAYPDPESTQVFNLVDNVLSLQKFDGTQDSHMNDYNKILDLSISKMNSILEASKTFETFFVTLEEQIKSYVHQIVSSYIESQTYMTEESVASSTDQSKSLDQVFIKIRFLLDLILGMREGCDTFIVASEHAFFVKNNFLFTFIPEKFSREKQLPSDYMICGVGSTIYVVSNSNNSLLQIETSSINSEETFTLKELLGNDIPVICIGDKNGNLALIQKINGKIVQNILTLDQQNKNMQTELYESTMNDSKFYFRDGKLYEVGDKTFIDGILSEEKPIYPIYAEKTSSFFIEDGKILYQKYPGENKSEIIDSLLTLIKPFPTTKDKFINPLLHDKKVNYLQFTQNITSTSRLILYIMERVNVLPQEHRIGLVAGLMTILTINLRHFAFQNVEPSTMNEIYNIYKHFSQYSTSLSISILQWMSVIPSTIYSDTFIVNQILRPAFSYVYMNKEYSAIKDFVLKKPQSLILVSEDLISQLPDQEGILLIIKTIDYLPICYEAMNAVESCAEYVSIVLKTISKLLDRKMIYNANRYFQHLVYSLSTLNNSHQIAEVFIKDSMKNLIKLSKEVEKTEISDTCDKNFTGLESVYTKQKDFFEVYHLVDDIQLTIDAGKIRNLKVTVSDELETNSTLILNGTKYTVQNGLVVEIFSSIINLSYIDRCDEQHEVILTVQGSRMEPQPEDNLEPSLTSINYVAKTIGSFIDQLLNSNTISRLEYDNRHLIGNSFIREFESFSKNSENVNYFEKKDDKMQKFLDFMDKISGINMQIKKRVRNFDELLEKVLSVYIFQLNAKEEVEKLINEQELTKDKVSHKLRHTWTCVSGLRRELLSLKQKEIAETNKNKYSLQDFIQNITEKCQFLTSSKLSLNQSDEDVVKYLNDLFVNYIPVQDIMKIAKEQNKRLSLRKISLDVISEFINNSSVFRKSTIETFLINIKVSFSIITDERSSLIGKFSLYNSLLESLENCIESFYSAMVELKSDCMYISFMKFFCKCPSIVQKFTQGIIYILTNSSKKFLKYAESVLVSLSNEPIVIETINNGALEIDDEDYRATAFFILSLSENAKVPYEILFSKKKSQKCEVASLLLAGKLLVKDKEGEAVLRANLDNLVEELSQTMTGEDNRFSVCAEIISFFRFLLLPFSVHKDFILEYLHSLFVTKTMIFTNKIIATFLILGHPLFRAEDTGVVYNSSMIRILYNDVKKEEIDNVYPMVRISIDPNTFTLTPSEVSVVVGLQEKINGIVAQNKPVSLHKANDIEIFYCFLATALQNPQNAEQFKPHAAKMLKYCELNAITRKGISPAKLMNRLAETLYTLSLFPEISSPSATSWIDYKFISMTTGIVHKNHLDSASVGISLFVGERKIQKNHTFSYRIVFDKPGTASIGFIDANSIPTEIKFYGLTKNFNKYSNVTASLSPNSICVSDLDKSYISEFLTGDMLPAIITINCRVKMSYSMSNNSVIYNPPVTPESPLFDDHIPHRVIESNLGSYDERIQTFNMKVVGEKVRTKNGIIGEIDSISSRSDPKLNIRISNRDGSNEIVTIQAKNAEVIPEKIHTLVSRAKRKSRDDKNQDFVYRNNYIRKYNRMVGKLMLLCLRSIIPLISSNIPLSTLETIMDYALPFTFGVSNQKSTKVTKFTSPYITNINYRFPGDREFLSNFVQKELQKYNVQDIINYIVQKISAKQSTSSNCVYHISFYAMRTITVPISLKEDEAVIFPLEFNSQENVGATIPNGNYRFRNQYHIQYICVPKYLPETDIMSSIVVLHFVSSFIDVSKDKITFDDIHNMATSILNQMPNNNAIINSMRLFIEKNTELACYNKKYIPSVLEEIRSLDTNDLGIISFLANLKQKIIYSLDIESEDFEHLAREICAEVTKVDKQINEFMLVKAFQKFSLPTDRFNIIALNYVVDQFTSLKQIYKIALESNNNYDCDVDINLYEEVSEPIKDDALKEIRRKMLIRFMSVETSQYSQFFDVDYFRSHDIHLSIKSLPNRYQIFVSFNRFSAFKFFEGGDSGKSLMQQFASQYTDYSCLAVIGAQPWRITLYGENAIDAGGPGRELFSQVCEEILKPQMKLFCLTPNAKSFHEEEYLPCIPNGLSTCAGAFIAACATSMLPFQFKICTPFWRSMTGKPITIHDVYSIYNDFAMLVLKLQHANYESEEEFITNYKLNFVIQDLYGNQMEIIPNGKQIKVTLGNLQIFITTAQEKLVEQLNNAIDAFKEGFYQVLPQNLCATITTDSLVQACCGIDFIPDSTFLNYFNMDLNSTILRQSLIQLTQEERFGLLKFASGSRNPKAKIHVHFDRSKNSGLPTATTCILAMTVPMYKSVQVCTKSLRAAIQFSSVITDSDFDIRMFNFT